MDPQQPSERTSNTRRFARYELDAQLKVSLAGSEHSEIWGRALNLNQGGIGGMFVKGWDIGTSVQVQFTVPVARAPVRLKGVVRNRVGYRYGFEFIDLTPEERDVLRRTCTTLSLLE
jgi:hypothetical protein